MSLNGRKGSIAQALSEAQDPKTRHLVGRRVAQMILSPALLAKMFCVGTEMHFRVSEGLPTGAAPLSVALSHHGDVCLIVEHKSFPMFLGGELPVVVAHLDRLDIPQPDQTTKEGATHEPEHERDDAGPESGPDDIREPGDDAGGGPAGGCASEPV